MPLPSFISLLYQGPESESLTFARAVILRLGTEKDYLIVKGQKYFRNEIYSGLIVWARQNFPEFEKADPATYSPSVLYQLLTHISGKIKASLPESNLPTPSQLEEWGRELEKYEDWLKRINQVDNTTSLEQLKQFDLKTQIEKIKKFQQLIQDNTKELLADYLTPEERTRVIEQVSQHLTRAVIQKKEGIDEDFVWQSIEDLCDQEPLIAAALTKEKRDQLVQRLANTISQSPEVPSQLAEAQEKLDQATLIISPSREQLKTTFSQQAGLSKKQAENLVCRLEASWPENPHPTPAETKETIRQNLSLTEIRILRKNSITEDYFVKKTAFSLQNYFQTTPLAQQPLDFIPVSKKAVKWAKRLKKEPTVIEHLLRGITPEWIEKEVGRLEGLARKPEAAKLKYLLNQVESIDVEKLPFFLRWQVKRAQFKTKVFGFLEKVNPFSFGFYRHYFPQGTKYIDEKINFLKTTWNHLRETPAGLILSPRHWYWKQRYLFHLWRWRQWGKLVKRITKNRRLRRFLFRLPKRMSPGYWLKRGAGKLLIKVGTKLGQKALGVALRNAGQVLIKKGLVKGGAYLLGGLLGISTGGIGTVVAAIAAGVDLVVTAVKFLGSPEFKQLMKKLWNNIKQIAIGAIALLTQLIAQLPFTFLLASIGLGFFGPAGLFLGGTLGFIIDSGVKFLGGLGGLGLAAGSLATAPTAMITAASISPALTTTAVIGVGGSLGIIAFGALISHTSRSSVFVAPPEIAAEVRPHPYSEYFEVQKTNNPSSFSTQSLEQIWNRGESATVNYEIKITAKEKNIVITSVEDRFSVYPSGPPTPSSQPEISLPLELSAGQSTTYTYQLSSFNQQYLDSVVSNKVIVTADVIDGPSEEQSSDIAMVIFGEAPILCFAFNGPWTESQKNWEIQAMAYLSQWPHFSNLLCSHGPITLTKMSGSTWGGWAKGINEIAIYDAGVSSYSNALYTLAHESGHLIDFRNDQLRARDFRNSGAYVLEGFLPTYPEQSKDSESEDFAETIALYPVWEIMTFRCCGKVDYHKDYPLHYNFANDFIFNP